MASPWLWGYSDRLSARPGERVALHLAGTVARCAVEVARVGVPANLEIIATAPATLGEPQQDEYSRVVPPEPWDVLARAYGSADTPEVRRRLLRRHPVTAAFRRGAGEVFNAGTTEWAYGLAARDPFVDGITRNVLDRFLG